MIRRKLCRKSFLIRHLPVTESIDYDGAWKETLERYLRPFLELCFPLAAAGIDWAVPIEFLDQELQQVVRDADLGKQRTDKLVKDMRRSKICHTSRVLSA